MGRNVRLQYLRQLEPGQRRPQGLHRRRRSAASKYEDLNADGVREPGEPGLSGWKIELFFEGKYVTSTTTGAGGAYSFRLDADAFPQLGEGSYTLKEESREGWRQEEAPGPIAVHYGVGEHNYGGNDFGNWRPATISGHKFDDSSVDGIWGPSEEALSNWDIQLSDGDESSTGPDGSYSFSVRPGAYTVAEAARKGWRQTAPGTPGTFERTVISGQEVEDLDFGNVCLGGVAVEPLDDSTGEPIAGLEVRLEEVSVPGILANEPSLPRTTAEGEPRLRRAAAGRLPGHRLPARRRLHHRPRRDPGRRPLRDRQGSHGRRVRNDRAADPPVHRQHARQGDRRRAARRSRRLRHQRLRVHDPRRQPPRHARVPGPRAGLNLHTARIEAIHISGEVAWIWGKVEFEGAEQRFRLRLVDAGEPGREDRFELTVAPGYEAGQGEADRPRQRPDPLLITR